MSLNNITFNVINGGLGRIANDEDNISALLSDAPVTGAYAPGQLAKAYRNMRDMEADGITANSANYAMLHYQAKSFFAQAPGAKLYLCFMGSLASTSTYIAQFAQQTNYEVKQIGCLITNFAHLNNIKTIAQHLDSTTKSPSVFVVGLKGDFPAPESFSSLASYDNYYASVIVAGEKSAETLALKNALGLDYIPAVGHWLGAIARSRVNINQAWVENFNFVFDYEYSDGVAYNQKSLSAVETINDNRYVGFRKFPGRSGTYLTDNHTASEISGNDYAYLNDTRTMNKAKRLLYSAYLPKLNSPIKVDATTGELAPTFIDYLEGIGEAALNRMVAADEIAGFSIYINPNQDILATSKLTINVVIVVNGVARNIVFEIGLVPKLQ